MASASETTSRTRMRPPHFRQRVMSSAKIRARSFAQPMRRGLGEDVGEDALLTFIPDTEQPCRSVLDPYYQLCPGVFLAP